MIFIKKRRITALFNHQSFILSLVGGMLFNACTNKQNKDGTSDKGTNEKPDILLIMADDMGFSDIGCYGGEINTPNIDDLAMNGVRFSQFYNSARCCPTRASLLTGLYPHQTGIGHMTIDSGHESYRGNLNNNCVTLAEVLKQAGYNTYMSGKWHVTRDIGFWNGDEELKTTRNWPLQRGFDRFFGTIMSIRSFFNPISLVRDNNPIEPETEEFYYTNEISDNAIRYIQEHLEQLPDKPFFCYVAYTAPHWPLHAPEEDILKYHGKFDAGWDKLRTERMKRMQDMGLIDETWSLTERDPEVPAWKDATDKEWQLRRMEVYAAMIDRMDTGIGKIIDKLKDAGRYENTLIIFLSDNGGCAEEVSKDWTGVFIPEKTRDGKKVILGNEHRDVMPGPEESFQSYGIPWANVSNTPFRLYKHYVHEGGIATPLIIHWPSVIKSKYQWIQTPGHVIDIMPTIIDAASAGYPKKFNGNEIIPMEGISLLRIINDEPIEKRTLFFEHEGNCAIREGKWKLVKQHGMDWELFDMETDRSETNDLSIHHPDIVSELRQKYESWTKRAGVLPWPIQRVEEYGPFTDINKKTT